ncbi:phage tail sheath subtilisin-like domain-containing protein [Desulfosporosinus sp. PR]|uniref:phage tail sheath subtilisin-like domain-containing protein n=1 Tax=Candidatus Desulfosporosinus nitrosoreducens TaxID=3401928 RepID=UPI0027E78BA6|nr:phage tail sheath subtilisin-like domain-containing protein [Desulfosporosinus sp. PR]MDQ7096762.1 phage tail sheath subtilisin-like domain-containing protein [Desulfosporosinus sp. PR]
MPEYLSPGVYVEEYESGSVPMAGVGTSTAGFVGLAEKGPVIGKPQFVTSISDYMRIYGSYLSESKYGDKRFLPYAVESFFVNGGTKCYIMRVAPSDAKAALGKAPAVLTFAAASPGEWGNRIKISVTPASRQKSPIYEVQGNDCVFKTTDGFFVGDIVAFDEGKSKTYNKIKAIQENTVTFENPVNPSIVDKAIVPTKYVKSSEINISIKCDDLKEDYNFVSLNPDSPDYILSRLAKSELVTVNVAFKESETAKPPEKKVEKNSKGDKADDTSSAPSIAVPEVSAPVSGGFLPPFEAIGAKGTGITVLFEGGSEGNIAGISAADYMGSNAGPGKRTGIQAFIEVSDVSMLAVPGITIPEVQLSLVAHCELTKSRFAVLDVPRDKKKIDEILEYKDMFDSSYAAMYHPWLESFDSFAKKRFYLPPSATMCGIYARCDLTIGVHKAPANEVVRACTGLEYDYNSSEQDRLNPAGVNLIRSFPGRGIRVWGARTCSSNGNWKYVNVRRLFIYLEESIKANTNWVVFEPNTEILWARVQRSVELFLSSTWRAGALAGSTPDEAFFVNIGRNTMTQDDIDNGRLICVIGVAPVKPAEFVIFRIGQYTANSGE